MRAKKRAPIEHASRVRHLIALDAANVLRRLALRQDELVSLFSRLRDRTPLLTSVHSWFATATFGDLAALSPLEQVAVNRFYAALAELRWYLEYTQDMPGQVQLALAQRVRELVEEHRALTAAIGGPDGTGAPVVEAQVVGQAPLRRRRKG